MQLNAESDEFYEVHSQFKQMVSFITFAVNEGAIPPEYLFNITSIIATHRIPGNDDYMQCLSDLLLALNRCDANLARKIPIDLK